MTESRAQTGSLYAQFDALLQGRCAQKRRVDNHTWLERRERNQIVLKLHQTDIITCAPHDVITVYAGGWQTATTKDRLNNYLGKLGFGISQVKGVWYWCTPGNWNASPIPFTDHDQIIRGELKAQAQEV